MLKKQNNTNKDLPFLCENKLIFQFQKNIVRNMETKRENKKYSTWFDFAKKTLQKDNEKEDFSDFEENKAFKEVIRVLNAEKLTNDDVKYLKNE